MTGLKLAISAFECLICLLTTNQRESEMGAEAVDQE